VPVIPQRLKWEDQELKGSPGYISKPCLNQTKPNNTTIIIRPKERARPYHVHRLEDSIVIGC
jgi:hypothetical protein